MGQRAKAKVNIIFHSQSDMSLIIKLVFDRDVNPMAHWLTSLIGNRKDSLSFQWPLFGQIQKQIPSSLPISHSWANYRFG